MPIPADTMRALKAKVRSQVDELEAKRQPIDPRAIAEQVMIAHAPIASLPLAERAAIVGELEAYARDLLTQDTHA